VTIVSGEVVVELPGIRFRPVFAFLPGRRARTAAFRGAPIPLLFALVFQTPCTPTPSTRTMNGSVRPCRTRVTKITLKARKIIRSRYGKGLPFPEFPEARWQPRARLRHACQSKPVTRLPHVLRNPCYRLSTLLVWTARSSRDMSSGVGIFPGAFLQTGSDSHFSPERKLPSARAISSRVDWHAWRNLARGCHRASGNSGERQSLSVPRPDYLFWLSV